MLNNDGEYCVRKQNTTEMDAPIKKPSPKNYEWINN